MVCGVLSPLLNDNGNLNPETMQHIEITHRRLSQTNIAHTAMHGHRAQGGLVLYRPAQRIAEKSAAPNLVLGNTAAMQRRLNRRNEKGVGFYAIIRAPVRRRCDKLRIRPARAYRILTVVHTDSERKEKRCDKPQYHFHEPFHDRKINIFTIRATAATDFFIFLSGQNIKGMDSRDGKGSWWRFSARERRAVLLLLPLLGTLSFIIYRASQPRFEHSFTRYADHIMQTPDSVAEPRDSLFRFDPNTVQFHDLCRLGIRFRKAGKVFAIPEDFAACYAVSEQKYLQLLPYIQISPQYALKPVSAHTPGRRHSSATHAPEQRPAKDSVVLFPFMPDTISAKGLCRLGFSPKQAQAIVNFREKCGGFASAEQFGESFVVSQDKLSELLPYMIFNRTDSEPVKPIKVEINSADSTALRSVYGIGAKTVVEIMAYRQRLGGFHCAEQIAEVKGITERNFERICPQIWIDTCIIKKIDINFAPAKALAGHPYISPLTLRKLMKQRQLKGGWGSLEDLLDDKIFTPQEAKNIAPYLVFSSENR